MAITVQTVAGGVSVGYFNKYYSKKLLDHAIQILVMNQFAQEVDYPKSMGSKTIRFMRQDVGSKSNVQTLTEGTPIATSRSTTLTAVDATLVQYGEIIATSDILGWTDLFSTMEIGIQQMGEDAALHADFTIMQEVVSGIASGNKRYSGGATSFNALSALSAGAGKATIADILGAMTKLTITRAPYAKGGEYVAVVPPQLAYDIMLDSAFVTAGEYGSNKGLFTGEIGRWYNVRCIVATQPWVESSAEGTYDNGAGAVIYSTIVTGSKGYGCPKLAGQSPFSPRTIITTGPDKADPLDQFATAGWKAFWVAKTLNDTWNVVLRSKTTFA